MLSLFQAVPTPACQLPARSSPEVVLPRALGEGSGREALQEDTGVRSQAGVLGLDWAALSGGWLPSIFSVDSVATLLAQSSVPVTCPVLGDMSDLKGVLPQGGSWSCLPPAYGQVP